MYGSLINGAPLIAPNPLHINGAVVYNPPDSIYAAAGYLPIVETPCPDVPELDAAYYTPSWVEQDGQIVQVWAQTDPPEPKPVQPTTEERIDALEAAMLAMMGGSADV